MLVDVMPDVVDREALARPLELFAGLEQSVESVGEAVEVGGDRGLTARLAMMGEADDEDAGGADRCRRRAGAVPHCAARWNAPIG